MEKSKDCWNPKQYQKFAKERNQPFDDLVKLVIPHKEMSVLDLGCGTGELTSQLHHKLTSKHTLGIDSSRAMLDKSAAFATPSLQFKLMNIEDLDLSEKYDLIFSNAALQWVPDHTRLFERITDALKTSGQIAIQMPYNMDYPTHLIAKELSAETPFQEDLKSCQHPDVLKIECYSRLLFQLGYSKQNVRIQIYPHKLDSTDSLIEWVKGSLLTQYESKLSSEKFQLFLNHFQNRVKAHFGDIKPFFVPFKRLLIWAKKE